MKHKMLLLILAAMLMAVAAHAAPVCGDGDTLWTKSMLPDNAIGVMFHPSGETIVVSLDDNGLVELNAETGDSLRTITHSLPMGSSNSYSSFDISSDGNFLFAVDYNHRGLIWDYHTGLLIRSFEETTLGKFIPNSDFLIFSSYESTGHNFTVYDVTQDSIVLQDLREVGLNCKSIGCIGASADGKYFALSSFAYDSPGDCERGWLFLYDAHTFEEIGCLFYYEPGSNAPIFEEIIFSENSKWICAYHTGKVKVIDLEQYIFDKTINTTELRSYQHIKFAGDDNTLILGDDDIRRKIVYRLNEKDTIYYVNLGSGAMMDHNSNTNNWLVYSGLNQSIYMFNNAFYTLDVPNEALESKLISQVVYQSGVLSFSVSEIFVQSIRITDTKGNTIYTNQVPNYNTNNQINISLPNGVYFLTVSNGENLYNKKFFVVD